MKTLWLKWAVPALAMTFLLSACKDNAGIPTQPDPSAVTAPNLRKAIGSETDFQQFEYDAGGRLTQYVSQWQYVQSDPTQIRRLENNFEYNAAGQLTTVRSQGGSHQYFYKNGALERVESRAANRLISTTYFLFDAKNRVIEREEIVPEERHMPDDPAKTKWKYAYDAKGNCAQVDYYIYMNEAYKLYESTDYSDFDNSANPFDQLAFFPYVPWVKFQVNNPGKQTTTAASTGDKLVTTFQYQYDGKGVPIQRTMTQRGFAVTLKLEY